MMKYNPAVHKRQSIRLKGYDYSQAGLYFITVCVKNRELLFGKIENNEMILNDAGQLIQTEWGKLPQRFGNIELHEFVVMPNHFHGILEIAANETMDGVPQNDMGDGNDNDKPPVGATLVVAPNDRDAPNDNIARNGPVAQNDRDAQNDNTARNKNIAQNDNDDPSKMAAPTNKTVGDMIGAFKSLTTVEYIHGVKNLGWQPFDGKLWQRDFYEHIIRNERAYENISDYITANPARWQDDKFYKI